MQQRKQLQGGKTNGTSGSHAETKKYPSVSDNPVEEEKVKAMIEAAILAPTWKNAQEIRYYVAVSEEKRQAVLDALGEGNRKKTQNAPVFLISAVILNRARFQRRHCR